MSAEDEDSQKKAHSALVDFFVMFRNFRSNSYASVVPGVLMIIGIFTIMTGGTGECRDMQSGIIIENCQGYFSLHVSVAHTLILGSAIWVVIIFGFNLYWAITKRKTHRDLLQIHSSFIHRSYVTMFEFVRPEGETKIDKLFNHLSLVFPEVEKFKKRLEEPPWYLFWLKKHRKFSEREESLFYPKDEIQKEGLEALGWKVTYVDTWDFITVTGMFLLVIFKMTVKWEDVEKMIKENNRDQTIEKLLGNDVRRIIYLADEYDSFFETDDFVSKMTETKRKFKLDLIKEDNLGYSTIWIDR